MVAVVDSYCCCYCCYCRNSNGTRPTLNTIHVSQSNVEMCKQINVALKKWPKTCHPNCSSHMNKPHFSGSLSDVEKMHIYEMSKCSGKR